MFLLATNWRAGRLSLFCLRSFALLFKLVGELGLTATWADSCICAPRTHIKQPFLVHVRKVPYLNKHESFNKYALKDNLFACRIFLPQDVHNQLKTCRKLKTWHPKFGVSSRFQLQTSNIICLTTGMNVRILHRCEMLDSANPKTRIHVFRFILIYLSNFF